jgi:hypothetical protein
VSMYLVTHLMDISPAEGRDHVLLLHLARTVNIPGAGKTSLVDGAGLSPEHQTRETRSDGGGFESLAVFGRKVWPNASPQQQKTHASNYTRRLAGQPNGTGQAWFPALLWEIESGATQDRSTGEFKNRPSVWRVPLTGEAVLVPVPFSGTQAAAGVRPNVKKGQPADAWKENWTVDQAWAYAERVLTERRIEEAVAQQVEQAIADLGYEPDGDERHRIDQQARLNMQVCTGEDEQIATEVRAYMADARRRQDEAMARTLRSEAWHPLSKKAAADRAGRNDAKAPRKVAGRANLKRRDGASPNPVSEAYRVGESPNPAVEISPNPAVEDNPNPAAGEFPNHAFGVPDGVSSGDSFGVADAAVQTSAPSSPPPEEVREERDTSPPHGGKVSSSSSDSATIAPSSTAFGSHSATDHETTAFRVLTQSAMASNEDRALYVAKALDLGIPTSLIEDALKSAISFWTDNDYMAWRAFVRKIDPIKINYRPRPPAAHSALAPAAGENAAVES